MKFVKHKQSHKHLRWSQRDNFIEIIKSISAYNFICHHFTNLELFPINFKAQHTHELKETTSCLTLKRLSCITCLWFEIKLNQTTILCGKFIFFWYFCCSGIFCSSLFCCCRFFIRNSLSTKRESINIGIYVV